MVALHTLLTQCGVVSCAIGAILGLISHVKGREARQLLAATEVNNLSGEASARSSASSSLLYLLHS
jgi:hypothetical protein